MTREPNPFAALDRMSSEPVCAECESLSVAREGDVCEFCEEERALTCDWCGNPTDEGVRFCSSGCAKANICDDGRNDF